jgi:transcriptional regulator with PAS, ATPase and Fis domain
LARPSPRPDLAARRRVLQLETLYDLALALEAHRPEEELVEELVPRVCAALDPRAAVAVTRTGDGSLRAWASVGWPRGEPRPEGLLRSPLWAEMAAGASGLELHDGLLAGRPYRQLLAARIAYRDHLFGFLAVLDQESRDPGGARFEAEDARFLESVGALAGVVLESARQVEALAGERERLEEENRALKDQLVSEVEGRRIVAHAPAMRDALERAQRIAPRGVNVLVRGESGTGKELVSRLLHVQSGRPGALIALNCGALPESLLESELFGIEGGVATGVKARHGRFELAHEGTLFLDEVGDLAPALQVKLLRAIQEREIVRVGGQKPIPVDVRIVSATHRNLEQMVQEGTFREDLYYRLRGVDIELPPLRERREDVPHLVRHFAREFVREEGLPEPSFSQAALQLLLAYEYPGNVRELQNVVEAAISLAVEGRIDDELVRSLLGQAGPTDDGGPDLDLDSIERRHIEKVLELTDGNKSEAARILGISRRTLLRKGY